MSDDDRSKIKEITDIWYDFPNLRQYRKIGEKIWEEIEREKRLKGGK